MPAILLSAIGEQLAELASPTNRNLARSQVLVESSSTDDWDLVRQKTLKRQLICPHDPWTDSVRSNPPPAAPYVVVVPRGESSRRSTDHAEPPPARRGRGETRPHACGGRSWSIGLPEPEPNNACSEVGAAALWQMLAAVVWCGAVRVVNESDTDEWMSSYYVYVYK